MARLPSFDDVLLLPLSHEAMVSDDWIDVMGHMNVAYYTAAFSNAMQSVRSKLGMNNEKVLNQQIGSFVIETHTRYLAELRVGERLQIYSRLISRSESQKRLHAMHFLVNTESRRLSATCEGIVANVDLKARRMVPYLPEILLAVDEMIEQHDGLPWAAPTSGALRL